MSSIPQLGIFAQDTLVCSVCEQEKSRDLFHMINNPRHQWIICKDCAVVGKHCADCGKYALFEAFPKNGTSTNRGGVAAYCFDCKRKRQRDEHKRNGQGRKHSIRASQIKHKFNLNHEEYLDMVQQQMGLCAICGQGQTRKGPDGIPINLAVDHCHTSHVVRELLCSDCNMMLGSAHDNPEILARAIAYLKRHAL